MDFKLYLITDRKLFTDNALLFTVIEDALKAGVRAVQLREKDLPTRDLLGMAYKMRELTARYNARLFINGSVDIAMCSNADGIHLGQAGMPVFAVRKTVEDRFVIGVSTHNFDEAVAAEKEGADFITFGPLYHTPSKLKYGEPVGLDSLRKVKEKVSVPIFGIGGIKPDNVEDIIGAGAYGVALISGILGESDVKTAAESYLDMISKCHCEER